VSGYDGGIDEVAVYGRALTPGEVAGHYTSMQAGDHTAYGVLVSGDSPVSYWRLDEVSGSVAADAMSANPGTYQGTPTLGQPGVSFPSPVVGSSVGFDGDDVVDVGDVSGLVGDVSFELWLKPSDLSVRRNPLAKAYSGEGTITQNTDGSLSFYHGSGGGNTSGWQSFKTASVLPPGVWSHVVVTRSGSTVTWFVNGVQDSQRTSVVAASSSSLPLLIGDGYVSGYDGGIDEVAVYGRALTLGEVAAHYTSMQAGDHTAYGVLVAGDSPVSYWRLDEVVGPTAADAMSANPGTYQGTPTFGEPGVSFP